MLAEKNGIPTSEAPFTMQELADADEIIVSSSGGLCIQAVELDGKPIGGKDPKTLKTLQDAFCNLAYRYSISIKKEENPYGCPSLKCKMYFLSFTRLHGFYIL